MRTAQCLSVCKYIQLVKPNSEINYTTLVSILVTVFPSHHDGCQSFLPKHTAHGAKSFLDSLICTTSVLPTIYEGHVNPPCCYTLFVDLNLISYMTARLPVTSSLNQYVKLGTQNR